MDRVLDVEQVDALVIGHPLLNRLGFRRSCKLFLVERSLHPPAKTAGRTVEAQLFVL